MKRRRLKINMKTSGSEEELKVQVTKATTWKVYEEKIIRVRT
jgi:hypothetical protein